MQGGKPVKLPWQADRAVNLTRHLFTVRRSATASQYLSLHWCPLSGLTGFLSVGTTLDARRGEKASQNKEFSVPGEYQLAHKTFQLFPGGGMMGKYRVGGQREL